MPTPYKPRRGGPRNVRADRIARGLGWFSLALGLVQREPVPVLMAADRIDIPHTLKYNLGTKYANLSYFGNIGSQHRLSISNKNYNHCYLYLYYTVPKRIYVETHQDLLNYQSHTSYIYMEYLLSAGISMRAHRYSVHPVMYYS